MAHSSNPAIVFLYLSELFPLVVISLREMKYANPSSEINMTIVNEQIAMLVLTHSLAPDNDSKKKSRI